MAILKAIKTIVNVLTIKIVKKNTKKVWLRHIAQTCTLDSTKCEVIIA